MTVKIDKKDEDFLKQFEKENSENKEKEEKYKFAVLTLKKLGIIYSGEHNFHFLVMNEFLNGEINIHQLKELFKTRFKSELKKRGLKNEI